MNNKRRFTKRYIQRKKNRTRVNSFVLLLLISSVIIFIFAIGLFSKANIIDEENVSHEYQTTDSISEKHSSEKQINVKTLCQMPDLPTGCEACSATMVLNYLGLDIDMYTIASILPCQNLTSKNGTYYGADPNIYFIGSPFTSTNSFGCFEDVIVSAINDSFYDFHAEKVSGTIEKLCQEYVVNDIPVLIWATMQMREIKYATNWKLENGKTYKWPGGEHCLVLVGFNEYEFYFNDPLSGEIVYYEKKLAEARYEEMGNRAVVIKPVY